MTDRYLDFTHSQLGQRLAKALGLPMPPSLRRARTAVLDQPFAGKAVLIGGGAGSAFASALLSSLGAAGAELRMAAEHPGAETLSAAAQTLNLSLRAEPASGEAPASDLYVFDAAGVDSAAALRQVFDYFQPRVARMPRNARIAIVVEAPAQSATPYAAGAHAALRGFVRSLGKEIGSRGATVNLIEVLPGGETQIAGALRFLLSDHSAFVTGQILTVGPAPDGVVMPASFAAPLRDKIAVVTGAARGIGAAIATALAREGATVVGLDRTQEEAALGATVSAFGGYGLALDITAPDAAKKIREDIGKRFGGVDVLVHNAGITRDKMLRNMEAAQWDQVVDVNFAAILRTTEQLLDGDTLRSGARIVCISSIGGIAGNAGQTNYGATKAGVIGFVEALAPQIAPRGLAINAIAPGFIETQMTAAMPVMPREVGRRLASLAQGGVPQDIAEAVLFMASPAAAGVNGRTLRVCGQNFFGA